MPQYGTTARLNRVTQFIGTLGRVVDGPLDRSRGGLGSNAVALAHNRMALVENDATDFHNLAPFYQGQHTDSACSLASATMVLNAFQKASGRILSAPVSPFEVLAKVPGETWERAVAEGSTGLTLDQLKAEVGTTLNQFGFADHEVRAVHTATADDASLASLKKDLLDNESSEKILIIANFDQAAIFGGPPSGHFAPLGTYDAATDRVLIMDPDRQSFEPFWVSTGLFLKSMIGVDSDSGLPRGYLVVRLK